MYCFLEVISEPIPSFSPLFYVLYEYHLMIYRQSSLFGLDYYHNIYFLFYTKFLFKGFFTPNVRSW